MFQFAPTALDPEHAQALAAWQADVDSAGNYEAQVARAKAKFSQQNKKTNRTFAHVKTKLVEMCCGIQRCAYCEDSIADEVEHIRPKDIYPESVFNWDNYVYGCGPCNGPKNNRFAIHRTRSGRCHNATRPPKAPVKPPPRGTPMLINPRAEDPLKLLFLDLGGTFRMLPMLGLPARALHRARYTIWVLRLNARDNLLECRRNAFRNYRARLREYVTKRDGDQDVSAYPVEVRKMDNRSVWLEMIRQRTNYPELSELFAAAPEALNW